MVERVKEVFADPSQKMGVMVQVAALGMNQPEDLSCLWDTLTLANRQRLIRLLVQEVRVDEFQQRVSVRFRDLAAIQEATPEEPSC